MTKKNIVLGTIVLVILILGVIFLNSKMKGKKVDSDETATGGGGGGGGAVGGGNAEKYPNPPVDIETSEVGSESTPPNEYSGQTVIHNISAPVTNAML